MPAYLLLLLVASQVTFPTIGPRPAPVPGGAPGATPLPDQSTISGQVRTRTGEPIPLATISVQTRQDATRADQRGDAVGWPGTLTRVKRDGTFRVAVPGSSTLEVCATVPAQPQQCRTIDVSTNDVQTLIFSF